MKLNTHVQLQNIISTFLCSSDFAYKLKNKTFQFFTCILFCEILLSTDLGTEYDNLYSPKIKKVQISFVRESPC